MTTPKLPPLPESVAYFVEYGGEIYTEEQMQAYAIAAIEAQASVVQQEPWCAAVIARRATPSGRYSHTVESDRPLPIGAILHTHPAQQAKPLTDEQIENVFDNTESSKGEPWFVRFARAIERAHGIGGGA